MTRITRIGIINIGLGNIKSIVTMLKYLNYNTVDIVSEPEQLERYSHIILPGVGHYSTGSQKLTDNWRMNIDQFYKKGEKILGICLGMQLLGKSSEEGEGKGLGLFDYNVLRIPNNLSYPVPHIGSSHVISNKQYGEEIFSEDNRYYFVHSYFVSSEHHNCIAYVDYNIKLGAAFIRDNVWGVQFHPEKSHKYGMSFFRSFFKESN